MSVIKRIYARNTIVKSVELDDAQAFVERYHDQGSASALTKIISCGLFHRNKLVGVAQFCSPRTPAKKREYTTELLRLCFKKDVQVQGGASKLIKHFIKERKPVDLFTYQATTGENSNVYEHSGFTLVKEYKTKQYLIAPNKTLETASRKRREVLSVSYAAKLGPDRILKTSLGEQFKDDGTRKTNIELFIELGWTLVETTGDKVYEWIDENRTFYTYKITATDSDKYYYGVSHIKKKDASIEDCMKHNYYGGGGRDQKHNKFTNWKKLHKDNLRKEVIGAFSRKVAAYRAEEVLVSDSWKTDSLCLNSRLGGISRTAPNLT